GSAFAYPLPTDVERGFVILQQHLKSKKRIGVPILSAAPSFAPNSLTFSAPWREYHSSNGPFSCSTTSTKPQQRRSRAPSRSPSRRSILAWTRQGNTFVNSTACRSLQAQREHQSPLPLQENAH